MIDKQYTCGVFWGAPSLIDESVEAGFQNINDRYISNESVISKMKVLIMGGRFSFKLVPIGEKSSMGHGCGSGYSASAIVLDDGTMLTGEITCSN